MRIAIPNWQGRISPVLDVAREIALFDLEDGHIIGQSSLVFDDRPIFKRVARLKENQVERVLCGALSRLFYQMLVHQGIRVSAWLTGDIETVMQAFLSGHIGDSCYRMPGCHGGFPRHRMMRRMRH